MSVKEKITYIWNVILGPDYTEQVDIEKSDDPIIKDSLERIAKLEQELKNSASKKEGKGNSSKVVETVEIYPKAIKTATKLAEQKQQKESNEKEQQER